MYVPNVTTPSQKLVFQRVRVGQACSEFTRTPHGGPQGSVITLFCWLLYINSICSLISDCKFGLFVDDIVLWVSDSDKLVSRFNKALGAIYDWALFHQMTFDFQKFHLLDVGVKLDNSTRNQIVFGPGSPPWSKEAPYLGILLDDKLSFKPFLKQLLKRLEDDTSWRLDKHRNFRYGASPRTLQVIFLTWFPPLFDYGSCVWIFRLYRSSSLHYSHRVDWGYTEIYKNLNSLYMGYMRNILGVTDTSASHLSLLVRLGVMPLNYMLAYRSAIWYLKLIRGLCGPALRDLYLRFVQNDKAFGSTNFFKPVHDFVKRLNSYCSHVNLESCPITEAKVLLRDAIYEELNMQWTQYDGSHTCHAIHPTWKPLRWQREMKSKLTCSWYHSVAVGRGRFRSRRFEYGMCDSPVSRFCGNENETVEHIFFRCSRLSEAQAILQKACKTHTLEFSLQKLFTKPKLQWNVEEFLYEIFKETINESNLPSNFSFWFAWYTTFRVLVSFTLERLW